MRQVHAAFRFSYAAVRFAGFPLARVTGSLAG